MASEDEPHTGTGSCRLVMHRCGKSTRAHEKTSGCLQVSCSPPFLPTSTFKAELQSQRRALKKTKGLENIFTQRYTVRAKTVIVTWEEDKKGQDKDVRVIRWPGEERLQDCTFPASKMKTKKHSFKKITLPIQSISEGPLSVSIWNSRNTFGNSIPTILHVCDRCLVPDLNFPAVIQAQYFFS